MGQLKVFHTACLDFSAGITNIFNSYQNDFDHGENRDSGYIYGSHRAVDRRARTFHVLYQHGAGVGAAESQTPVSGEVPVESQLYLWPVATPLPATGGKTPHLKNQTVYARKLSHT